MPVPQRERFSGTQLLLSSWPRGPHTLQGYALAALRCPASIPTFPFRLRQCPPASLSQPLPHMSPAPPAPQPLHICLRPANACTPFEYPVIFPCLSHGSLFTYLVMSLTCVSHKNEPIVLHEEAVNWWIPPSSIEEFAGNSCNFSPVNDSFIWNHPFSLFWEMRQRGRQTKIVWVIVSIARDVNLTQVI